jgi:hypothetical protein
MRTEDLVSLLAAGAAPVPANAVGRRFAVAMGWGVAGALLLLLSLGIRTDLAQAAGELMFWIKPAFAAGLALAGLVAAERLACPGMRLGPVRIALAAPVLLLWLIAAVVLANAAPAQRAELIFGETWKACPFNIALLSLPLFAAMLWAMKGLAPTRLAACWPGPWARWCMRCTARNRPRLFWRSGTFWASRFRRSPARYWAHACCAGRH